MADNVTVRLSGRTIDSNGYQTNVAEGPLHGDKLGGESTRSARASAVWDITDKIENYTVVSWDHKSTNGRGMVLKAANPTGYYLKCYDGPSNPNGACFEYRQSVVEGKRVLVRVDCGGRRNLKKKN